MLVDDVHALAFWSTLALSMLVFSSSSRAWKARPVQVTCLPISAGAGQGVDDRVGVGGAIQRHLDRQDLGILRGLLDELDDRPEGFIRVVDQDVLVADGGEDALATGEGHGHLRLVGRLAQVAEPLELPQGRQDGRVDRPGDLVDVAVLQLQGRGREQLCQEFVVGALGDLQADGLAPLALAQGLLDGRQQAAADLVLLDGQVAVAGDAEGDPFRDAIAAEEGVEPRADHVLQEDESPIAVGLIGQGDESVQDRRDLEHGVERPCVRLVRLDAQQQVQALVVHVRERVRRVDRQRGEHRVDLAVEEVIEVGVLIRVQLAGRADPDAVLEELGAYLGVPDLIHPPDEVVGSSGDLDELGQGPHAVGGRVLRLEVLVDLRLQPGDADLEELVEVRRADRQEAQPLQQGIGGIPRLHQHAIVEVEPAQLAVDEPARFQRRGRGGRGRGAGGHLAVELLSLHDTYPPRRNPSLAGRPGPRVRRSGRTSWRRARALRTSRSSPSIVPLGVSRIIGTSRNRGSLTR